tara:strand:- start:1163 stop:1750 length:588 start_codon:yes stop_codon:yes gene_type:complete
MASEPDHPVLAALLARRSVRPRRLSPPGPSPDDLAQIVAAGLRGVDHGNLRPWRLLLINDREALAEAFATAHRFTSPDVSADQIEAARRKAFGGPTVLALIAEPVADHPEIPVHEQWIAVGAAVQQMLLAAEALGFAGSILSGRKTAAAPLRDAFALTRAEHLIGFLTFGTAAADRPKRAAAPQPEPSAYWSRWP